MVQCDIWGVYLHRLFGGASEFGRAFDVCKVDAARHELDVAAAEADANRR